MEFIKSSIQGTNLYKNQLIPQRKRFVLDEVKLAAKRMGQNKIDEEIFRVAAKDLIDEIERAYFFYSLEEIAEVMRMGATGQLGDSVSISSRTFISWFKEYKQNQRPKLFSAYRSSQTNVLTARSESRDGTLSDEEYKEYKEYVIDEYRKQGDSALLFSFTYDIFKKNGETDIYEDNKEKYDLMATALLREKSAAKGRSFNSYVSEGSVVSQAKVLALKDYLKEIVQ